MIPTTPDPAPRRTALCLAALLVVVGGCAAQAPEDPEAVIRGWSRATNEGDFTRAGGFFAPNAVVQQGEETRLRGPVEAARFSASLPCRADVTGVVTSERTSLATFRLRAGRAPCSGEAEVRFAVRDGKLTEWRQLPPRAPARGLQASGPAATTESRHRTADGGSRA